MRSKTYEPLKRAIDLTVGGALLVLTLPLQVVVASLIRIRLGRPVLFRQPRPGKDEAIFGLVKFRTMRLPDRERGLVTDEQRMTRVGSFLRSTSLDELPTLWNVVRGDMSLVGPRPLLVQYLDRYAPEQRRRHAVRPGITGLAQVSGRNAITWDEKFGKDLEYVDHFSVWLDFEIMLRTVVKVLRREGISGAEGVTMTEFMGDAAGRTGA